MCKPPLPTLLFLITALCGVGLAQAEGPSETRIRLQPAGLGGESQVEVSGEWQTGCPPRFDRIEVVGADVRLYGKPNSQRCDGQPGPYSLQAELPPGALKNAPTGALRLSYLLQDEPLSPPRLLAFELVERADSGATPRDAAEPESGFWWGEAGAEFDNAGPGLSAQIERQSDAIALSFAGYDEHGNPDWMFGAATLQGQLTDIVLTRLGDGRGPFGDYVGPTAAEAAGRLQIEWLSASRATFWFSRIEGDGRRLELRPISMVRFEFGLSPGSDWVGRWLLENDDRLTATSFAMVRRLPDGFQMRGTHGELLSCDRSKERPTSPPQQCSLELADGNLWFFDDIGLTHLRGRDQHGERVRLQLLSD